MLKTLRFGVELEVVGVGRDTLASAVHSVVGGIMPRGLGDRTVIDAKGRTWTVVRDASLSGGINSGEVVSPILRYEGIEEFQRVVRAIRGAAGKVDDSCGLHLNISGDHIDAQTLVRLAKFMYKQERLIIHALGIKPNRLATYCKPIDEGFMRRIERGPLRTMAELNRAWYGDFNPSPRRYDSSRYVILNYNAFFLRNALEIRGFNASLHAGEVKAAIQFGLALVANAITSKAASGKRREFNQATARYDFRVVLLRLGLIGEEFRSARFHLLKRLEGSAAWKHGRPERAKEPAA